MSDRLLTLEEMRIVIWEFGRLWEESGKSLDSITNLDRFKVIAQSQDAETAAHYETVIIPERIKQAEQKLFEEIETKGLSPFDCSYLTDCRNKQFWLPGKCFQEECKYRDWQQLKQKRGK